MTKNENEYSFSKPLIAFLLLCGAGGGCAARDDKKLEPKPPGAVVTPSPAARVSATPLLARLPAPILLLTGSLKASREVSLSPRQDNARIAAVLVREGDSVPAGQVVLRLDDRDAAAQLRAAEATVAAARAQVRQAEAAYRQQVVTSASAVRSSEAALQSARAALSQTLAGSRKEEKEQADAQVGIARTNLRKAETDLARYERLEAAGAVAPVEVEQFRVARDVTEQQSRGAESALSLALEGARNQEIEQARQTVRRATEDLRQARAAREGDGVRRAEVDAARAALLERQNQAAVARQALSDTVLRSPLSGRVSAREAEAGQIVGTANTVLKVVASSVFFEPAVPENDLRHLRVDQRLSVIVDAIPGRAFAGRIIRISPTGQATGRSFRVRVDLAPDPSGRLRPGMFARVRLAVPNHESRAKVAEGV